jgi:hypothetical protein
MTQLTDKLIAIIVPYVEELKITSTTIKRTRKIMKVGIRFSDNDFCSDIKTFMWLYILPTFKETEPNHFTTYLTSSMIVELFNNYFPTMKKYLDWYHSKYNDWEEELIGKQIEDYFKINEMNIYWDDKTDEYIEDWKGNNNSEFIWTDGKSVFIS